MTGLLRREDAEEALRRYPLAVIPVGSHNKFAHNLFHNKAGKDYSDPRLIAEAAMAVVKHKIRPQDVMQITISDVDNSVLQYYAIFHCIFIQLISDYN